MLYEDALELWGAAKLRESGTLNKDLEFKNVRVEMDFNEGYNCCGGSDPSCYCSFAESPRANVAITGVIVGTHRDGHIATRDIPADDFDFLDVLGEIVRAGGGNLHSSD